MSILQDREKKRAVIAIMGKMKDGAGYEKIGEKANGQSDSDAAKEGSMRSFITAMKAEDAAGMSTALSNFFDLCQSGSDTDDDAKGGWGGSY